MELVHLSTLGPNISWIGEVCDTLNTTSLTSLVDNHWPTAGIRVNSSFLKAQSLVPARGDYNISKHTFRWLWRCWANFVFKNLNFWVKHSLCITNSICHYEWPTNSKFVSLRLLITYSLSLRIHTRLGICKNIHTLFVWFVCSKAVCLKTPNHVCFWLKSVLKLKFGQIKNIFF